MDHRFGLSEPKRKTVFGGQQVAPTKNAQNAKRCPMKKIPKPGESAFTRQPKNYEPEEEQEQQFSFFGRPLLRQQQKRDSESTYPPAETMSRCPIEPEEEDPVIYEPEMSKWIEPSDDELQPLPDIPREKIWSESDGDDY